jgi:hypothetical protein
MTKHNRAMEYAQTLGYVEGILKFIKTWTQDEDVFRAAEDGLNRVKEMDAKLWPVMEIENV